MSLFGYELLFRNGQSDRAVFSDGAKATAQVMAAALMDVGLDKLVGPHLAFINFERNVLMDDLCESLPPSRSVLEILETVEPDPALMHRLERLRAKGYRFALDDFVCNEPYTPFLKFADFVKFDLQASDRPAIERALSVLSKYRLEFIAEKVETREQFEYCQKLGFPYFQGYFFCKPENVPAKPLPASRLAGIRLLAQLNKPEVGVQEVERLISQDVTLTYKLIRYINSALCSLERHVESVRHAIVLVGLRKIRVWASLMVFSGFGDRTSEAIITGVQRGRMCELLAEDLHFAQPETSFLVGMFSVLDAVLNRPLDQVLSMLSLSPDIVDALLNRKGELGAILRCVCAHEQRLWDEVRASVKLDPDVLDKAYLEAVTWATAARSAYFV
jgi:EAL and modified HD-GYP domain-containing signal transduction protein